jgi:CRP/FNR family transcriptional regulator, cyclic AMP receptor protein
MSDNSLGVPELSANLARQQKTYGDRLRMVQYRRGQTVYTPTTMSRSVYLLVSGEVRLFRQDGDGRRFTLAVLRPGAVFGQASLLGSLEFDTYAEAVEPSAVWIVADSSAHEIFSTNADLSLSLLEGLGQRLVDVEARLELMAYKKVPARLAALLLQEMDPTGVVIGLTHQDLAELLGTYRETVSQAIREFRSRGVVRPGRKRIAVLDSAELRRIADQGE